MNRHPCLEPIPSQPKLTSKKFDDDDKGTGRAQRVFWGSIVPTLLLQPLFIGLLLILLFFAGGYIGLGGSGPGGGGEGLALYGLLALGVVAHFILVIFTGSVSLAMSREPASSRGHAFGRGVHTVLGSAAVISVGIAMLLGLVLLL